MTPYEVALAVLLGAVVAAALTAAALRRRSPTDVEVQLARLADAVNRQAHDGSDLRGDLGRAREILEALRAGGEARRRAEEQAWAVVHRLEAVLVGGAARGRAGENVLEEALSTLPPTLLVRDFAVGGKRVEFALVLPDGRRLPVDSKWTAIAELEALRSEEDPRRRSALVRRIEEEVGRRAREVAGYLEPTLTTPFAVACVPDAAFAVCRKAHAEAFARGVVLVPYGTALPVVLALFALAERFGDAGDLQGALVEMEASLGRIESALENKVVRATTMLHNAAHEVRTDLSRARVVVAGARRARPEPPGQERPAQLRALRPG
jgi:hypothetical protein